VRLAEHDRCGATSLPMGKHEHRGSACGTMNTRRVHNDCIPEDLESKGRQWSTKGFKRYFAMPLDGDTHATKSSPDCSVSVHRTHANSQQPHHQARIKASVQSDWSLAIETRRTSSCSHQWLAGLGSSLMRGNSSEPLNSWHRSTGWSTTKNNRSSC
jgi:hypothetical protein